MDLMVSRIVPAVPLDVTMACHVVDMALASCQASGKSAKLFEPATLTSWRLLRRDARAQYYDRLSLLPPGDRSVLGQALRDVASDLSARTAGRAEECELVEVDLLALAELEPTPPAFIIPGWLPEGEVTLFAADGGAGKSTIMVGLGVCAAVKRKWFGLDVQQRDVVFLSFEDKPETLHWRLSRHCKSMGVSMREVAAHFRVFDGTQAIHAWYARGENGSIGPTAAFHEAAECVGQDQLVIVDGAADVFAGNELSRTEVKAFVRMLRRLAGPRGAVLLISHVDKRAAQDPDDALGYSGSTAWSNSVRCRWYGYRERDGGNETGRVRIEVRKSNLGPDGKVLVLAFDPAAHVFRSAEDGMGTGNAPSASNLRRVVDSDKVLETIAEAWGVGNPIPAATSGSRTGYSVAKTFASYPQSARGQLSKRRFDEVVNELRNAGAIVLAEARRAGRHRLEVLCTAGQAATQSAECATQSAESP